MILQNNVPKGNREGCEQIPLQEKAISVSKLMADTPYEMAARQSFFSSEESSEPEQGNNSLDEAAKMEREYVRRRLRDEMGREPSEEEVDEWLRRHTEGY